MSLVGLKVAQHGRATTVVGGSPNALRTFPMLAGPRKRWWACTQRSTRWLTAAPGDGGTLLPCSSLLEIEVLSLPVDSATSLLAEPSHWPRWASRGVDNVLSGGAGFSTALIRAGQDRAMCPVPPQDQQSAFGQLHVRCPTAPQVLQARGSRFHSVTAFLRPDAAASEDGRDCCQLAADSDRISASCCSSCMKSSNFARTPRRRRTPLGVFPFQSALSSGSTDTQVRLDRKDAKHAERGVAPSPMATCRAPRGASRPLARPIRLDPRRRDEGLPAGRRSSPKCPWRPERLGV